MDGTVKFESREALCFGWIDGQMQKLDDTSYKKYFSERREKSKWSEKNKALAESLEKRGLMTDFGREKRLKWLTDRLDRNLRPMEKG